MKRLRNVKGGPSFRHTLLSRYLLIILIALMFIPMIFPMTAIVYSVIELNPRQDDGFLKYGNARTLESMWHHEASQLQQENGEIIDQKLSALKQDYTEASMFWVDASGTTRLQLPTQEQLPVEWTQADVIRFMKSSFNGDPFTIVAFLGANNKGDAFMVMQLPRSMIENSAAVAYELPFYAAFIFTLLALFVLLSLLFFRRIRKRLLRLQAAMRLHDQDGLPTRMTQTKLDEIGQLEASFNDMVDQLRASYQRERAEEELRKRLIANLSHDLRTPLTVMNSQVYSLRGEKMSSKGQAAIKQLEQKISSIGSLIDNLLSYTLMTSGRYPLKLARLDVLRLVRESAAAWYPLWEQEGIQPNLDLPEDEPLYWAIDKDGFRRVLDNLFQNIVRHAKDGQYIGIKLDVNKARTALVILDRGPGMAADGAHTKGAGIGLAIVSYLINEMKLDWHTESSDEGTWIYIYPSEETQVI